MGTVVVGFVPKPEGEAALRSGIAEAKLRGAKIVVDNSHRGASSTTRPRSRPTRTWSRSGRSSRSPVWSTSCANWCESDDDCFAWEIDNACGDFALSLRGLIDEEPIAFAEEYASAHCGSCGDAVQSIYLKRPGSDVIEGPDAAHESLLENFEPRCLGRQCVLKRLER